MRARTRFCWRVSRGGEKIGRYTFLGYNPFMVFEIRGKAFTIKPRHPDVQVLPTLVDSSMAPLDALKKIFAHCKTVPVDGLPRFTGGAVGYFGYDTIQLIEDIPSAQIDNSKLNDATLMFFDTLLVFDAVKRNVSAVANAYIPEGATEAQLLEEYNKAAAEIEKLKVILGKNIPYAWMLPDRSANCNTSSAKIIFSKTSSEASNISLKEIFSRSSSPSR